MASFEISSAAFKGEFQGRVSPARLTLTSTGETPAATDQTQLFDFLNRVVQAQVPFIAVYDLRVLGVPSPTLLRSLGDWCKAHQQEFEPLQIAIAILLKNNFWSSAVRKMIGIVTAICPPTCPLLTCHSLESVECFFAEKVSMFGDNAAEVKKLPSNKSNSSNMPRKVSNQSLDSSNVGFVDEPVPCQPPCFADLHLLSQSVSQYTDRISRFADLNSLQGVMLANADLDSPKGIMQGRSPGMSLRVPSTPRSSFASFDAMQGVVHMDTARSRTNHFIDLEDLNADARLVKEGGDAQIIEDDAQAMEFVEALSTALGPHALAKLTESSGAKSRPVDFLDESARGSDFHFQHKVLVHAKSTPAGLACRGMKGSGVRRMFYSRFFRKSKCTQDR